MVRARLSRRPWRFLSPNSCSAPLTPDLLVSLPGLLGSARETEDRFLLGAVRLSIDLGLLELVAKQSQDLLDHDRLTRAEVRCVDVAEHDGLLADVGRAKAGLVPLGAVVREQQALAVEVID